MRLSNLQRSINKKVPLNRAIISDILLWVAVAGLLAYAIYFMAVLIPNRRGQTIQLAFYNANEISRGAPVKLMGSDIGFVDDIRVDHDHVNVIVQTDPDALKIPSGSVFTILFTGLGGAKSIEVSLPSTPVPEVDGEPVYRVKEPISMRDALNASLDSVQALQQGSENISDFFGKRKPVEELQFNIQQAHEMSGVAVQNTIALNRGLGELRQDVNVYTKMGVDTLQDFNHGADIMARGTDPVKLKQQAITTTHNIKAFNDAFLTEGGTAVQLPLRLSRFNQFNTQGSTKLIVMNRRILTTPIPQWLDNFEKGQTTFQSVVDKMDTFFAKDHLPAIHRGRQNLQNFNQNLIQWQQKAEEWEQQGLITPPPQYRSPKPSAHKQQQERSIAIADQLGEPIQSNKAAWWHTLSMRTDLEPKNFDIDPQPISQQQSKPDNTLISLIEPIWNALCYLFK